MFRQNQIMRNDTNRKKSTQADHTTEAYRQIVKPKDPPPKGPPVIAC